MKSVTLNTVVKICSYDELSVTDKELTDAARNAAKQSYAPYSGFNVGAAVRLENGVIFSGCNQENAAYPSGLCAERTAIFGAHSMYPDHAIESLAVAARSIEGEILRPISPCGACRQVMLESEMRFKRCMRIILFGLDCCFLIENGVKDLLPLSFDSDYLK